MGNPREMKSRNVIPIADSSHETFGTTHVPRIGVGKDFGDSRDGFAAPGGSDDRSDLRRLSRANDFVDPKHVVLNEVSGLLSCAFVGERERFLLMKR